MSKKPFPFFHLWKICAESASGNCSPCAIPINRWPTMRSHVSDGL